METIEYRCMLVQRGSNALLTLTDGCRYQLPRVHILRAARPAQQLQKAIKAKWGLNIFVLDIWGSPEDPGAAALAELLTPESAMPLTEISIGQLLGSGLSEQEGRRLQSIVEGGSGGLFARLGWIDDAIAWMESATGRPFRTRGSIEQWNTGGGFALFRASSDDGRNYWFKATCEPNEHEFAITSLLSDLCPGYFPNLVAVRREWNGWLTEDAGHPLSDTPSLSELAQVSKRMAQLQYLTVGKTDELLSLGACDQRLPVLRSQIDAVIAFLIEMMARQTSMKVAALSRDRLLDLGEILRDGCFRLEAHEIPDALIHNDLNAGNILSDGTNYFFIDWSEAAVGNPFLSCERLCQLNRAHAGIVRSVYREYWSHSLGARSIDDAIALTPLLTIYAYLYSRGDWLDQRARVRPEFEGYARSLARHMDRAAQDLSLLETLCR